MTNKTLQQFIHEFNVKEGYEDDPSEDFEYFTECLSTGIVQEDTSSEHRWYDIRSVVHRVPIDGEDRFFKTFSYHITGDNSAGDMGLDLPTMNDVVEVFPMEITTTVYR
ncbi:hypothetical protein VPHK406_0193 [Vibrio phage K406]